MQSSNKNNRDHLPVLQGTENLVTVIQFTKEKGLPPSHKRYVYQFIKCGLIVPLYIGKNRDLYIDLEQYKEIKLRHLSRAEIREFKEQQQ